MKTETMGYVIDGELQLDHKVALPDHSRVRITVESDLPAQMQWEQALGGLEQLIQTQPINSQGVKFTRDELHERD